MDKPSRDWANRFVEQSLEQPVYSRYPAPIVAPPERNAYTEMKPDPFSTPAE